VFLFVNKMDQAGTDREAIMEELQAGLSGSCLAFDQGETPQFLENAAMCDEQALVPDTISQLNSMYFDEIYHPRTALEHLNNIYPYEVSHPPLGKLIMSLGIALFGMVPFGWRFMGTLFGVLMLPILYVFLKNFFGKTPVAFCGTCLFAFDFMHLVQTRIGTIDTYGVFFILVSYYFMYRWLCCPVGSSLRKTAVPLFLCGLFWGIGCACKWTVIYAGAGLAVMWLLGLVFRYREWKLDPQGFDFISFVLSTTSLSIIFFVLLPSVIYTVSYIPYATAQGNLTLDNLLNVMWSNQEFMLSYHQGVHSTHPYQSSWYQWIFDARPILYYRDLDLANTEGVKSLFASFNNPLVSWAGLLAFFAVAIQTIRRKCGRGLFILIAVLSQFLPWLPIGRTLFAYHYFPTILFLVFAIAYLMNDMLDRHKKGANLAVYGFTGCTVAVYAIFYPALTGLYIPLWYSEVFLRWFPSWPL
jgi:dolichyl-phosphate-mannose--protein O-mannosyl transferase